MEKHKWRGNKVQKQNIQQEARVISGLVSLILTVWRKARVTLRSPAIDTHPNLNRGPLRGEGQRGGPVNP